MGILVDMKKNAVVLQKPSMAIAVRVDMTSIQRKYYDVMTYIAKQELKKNPQKKIFTIPFPELQSILNKSERDKNHTYYKEKLLELIDKKAEYNILNKDKKTRIYGWVAIVSFLEIEERENKNEILNISFEFPEVIRRSIIDPKGIYANINLVVVAGLKSKYAIILYELVKDYVKVEIPEMTIEEFKKIFNVESKYKGRMDNLKRFVLEAAINEINNNENVDFFVFYELRKTGKVYTHIKFYIKPKPAKLKLQQQAKIIEAEVKENEEIKELLLMIPSEHRRKKKIISLLLGSVKTKGEEYTKAQIEYTVSKFNSGKVKDFVAYLKQAIEKDYASFEVVELGPDVVKPDDAVGYEGESIGKPETKIRILSVDEKEDEEVYIVSVKNMNTNEVVWVEVEREKILEYAKKNIEMKKKRSIL